MTMKIYFKEYIGLLESINRSWRNFINEIIYFVNKYNDNDKSVSPVFSIINRYVKDLIMIGYSYVDILTREYVVRLCHESMLTFDINTKSIDRIYLLNSIIGVEFKCSIYDGKKSSVYTIEQGLHNKVVYINGLGKYIIDENIPLARVDIPLSNNDIPFIIDTYAHMSNDLNITDSETSNPYTRFLFNKHLSKILMYLQSYTNDIINDDIIDLLIMTSHNTNDEFVISDNILSKENNKLIRSKNIELDIDMLYNWAEESIIFDKKFGKNMKYLIMTICHEYQLEIKNKEIKPVFKLDSKTDHVEYNIVNLIYDKDYTGIVELSDYDYDYELDMYAMYFNIWVD